jgi:hypothetical protein
MVEPFVLPLSLTKVSSLFITYYKLKSGRAFFDAAPGDSIDKVRFFSRWVIGVDANWVEGERIRILQKIRR